MNVCQRLRFLWLPSKYQTAFWKVPLTASFWMNGKQSCPRLLKWFAMLALLPNFYNIIIQNSLLHDQISLESEYGWTKSIWKSLLFKMYIFCIWCFKIKSIYYFGLHHNFKLFFNKLRLFIFVWQSTKRIRLYYIATTDTVYDFIQPRKHLSGLVSYCNTVK